MPKAIVEDRRMYAVPPAVTSCPHCHHVVEGTLEAHTCPVDPETGEMPMATDVLTPSQQLPPAISMLMAPLRYGLGTREEIETELDGIAMAVRTFPMKQPDQIMRECAAYCARLTELEVLLHRVEAADRQYLRVRTQQVDRWLQALEFQWKVASRLVEVMRQDLVLSGAQT